MNGNKNTQGEPLRSPRSIMIVVTSAPTMRQFVMGFARYLADQGHSVTIIADGIAHENLPFLSDGVRLVDVPMLRDPSPLNDLISLVRVSAAVRSVRPDVLAYATPKASLLASIAGAVGRVPVRVYQLWGLRLETVRGWRRAFLVAMERLTARLSTSIVANSRSLANRYRELRLTGRTQLLTLGPGSSHGVDLERFSRSAALPAFDENLAAALAARPGVVVGYVGRLHPDKGIDTLLDASAECAVRGIPVHLLLVGDDEGADVERRLEKLPPGVQAHMVGPVVDPRAYFATMDVLVLVSRREGFPNVVLESAAMEVPAIVSDATGAVDSVVPGVTGVVVPVGDAHALADAISSLADDPVQRRRLGQAAREHVERHFAQEDIWRGLERFLVEGLQS